MFKFKNWMWSLGLVALPCLGLAYALGAGVSSKHDVKFPEQFANNPPKKSSADNVPNTGREISTAIRSALLRGVTLKFDPLPPSAWQLLEATPAIQVGGEPGIHANIYVVFDANCPHCATLHQRLREDFFNGIPVRWVPIAFLRPDSAALAGAILASADPGNSLNVNYRDYDHESDRGGYRPLEAGNYRLGAAHDKLKRHWEQWGAGTPMIIIRTRDGTVLRVLNDRGDGLRWSLELAAPPAPILKLYVG